jgi:antitoxin MazE
MDTIVRSRVIKIGNSRGVRIPRALLEQAGLTNEVELVVEGNRLIIRAFRQPRQGWEDAFARMAELNDDRLLDDPISSQWDEDEWKWE